MVQNDLITLENVKDLKTLVGDCSCKIVSRGQISGQSYIVLDFSGVQTKSDEHFVTDSLQCEDQAEIYYQADQELDRLGFRLPKIFDWDRTSRCLLVQDLGGTRLADVPFSKKTWKDLIAQLAGSLVKFREGGDNDYPHLRSRCYDISAMKLEIQEYLTARETFLRSVSVSTDGGSVSVNLITKVKELLKVVGEGVEVLEQQLLGNEGLLKPEVPCHRDFQTYNIMINESGEGKAWIIDIQDACLGPLGYDLASLLWDPKFPLNTDLREELLAEYSRITDISYNDVWHATRVATRIRLIKSAGRQLHLYNSSGDAPNLERVYLALLSFEKI